MIKTFSVTTQIFEQLTRGTKTFWVASSLHKLNPGDCIAFNESLDENKQGRKSALFLIISKEDNLDNPSAINKDYVIFGIKPCKVQYPDDDGVRDILYGAPLKL